MRLEEYFSPFRAGIIGQHQYFESSFGPQRLIYADWTASGRGYRPIEERLQDTVLPFFGNTHTHSTVTGSKMTEAYEEAKAFIKGHVHAGLNDVLIFCGSGMTSAVNKLQRIMGLRVPHRLKEYVSRFEIDEPARPVIFVTHMEHHSNHISWLETIAQVEVFFDLDHLRRLLGRYSDRRMKIAAVTACSNVTGIHVPYREIASLMHEYGGLCFVDFACAAPYVEIDVAGLDAIYFSCHKFLGGPGTPGVLVFNARLYGEQVPDQPGGGTVYYTNPWGGRSYVSDIEQREDGGTPPILQGIKAAMCIRLKEEMGVANILAREEELKDILLSRLLGIDGVEVLEPSVDDRLGIVSFIVRGMHYNEAVRLLNDRFGIQARGGCSCAGTYGHVLLNIDRDRSDEILRSIEAGNPDSKPGWVRLSVHPTMTDAEIDYIADAVELTVGALTGV